ncbi:MAG TPA: hypothetical protein PLA85_04555 [Micropepsaceae bacterium]|nr:hypothetical protein [Micropepsaceae bacterium]HRK70832.1 hypothetical protein [Micropepsaceae bacterium]
MGGVSQTAIKAAIFGVVAAIVLGVLVNLTGMAALAYLGYVIAVGVGFLAVNWKKTTDLVANAIEGAIAGVIYGILSGIVAILIVLIFTGMFFFGIGPFLVGILIAAALAAVGGVLAGMMG